MASKSLSMVLLIATLWKRGAAVMAEFGNTGSSDNK